MFPAPISPNVHNHEVGLLLELSVNRTTSGAYPDVFEAEKLATGGGGYTVNVCGADVTQKESDVLLTESVTEYVPGFT